MNVFPQIIIKTYNSGRKTTKLEVLDDGVYSAPKRVGLIR
jgi:hypothetical protein